MSHSTQKTAQTATRGTLLLATRSGAIQFAQVASSLLIARLIAPDAYGTFAIALTGVGLARYVGDLGVSNSLITRPHVSEAAMRSGALISIMCGITCALALMVGAPLLAELLNGPSYAQVLIRILSVTIIFDALRFRSTVILNRELRFGTIGIVSVTETSAMYVCQIGLLLSGVGIWSLVAAQISRSIIGLLLLLRIAGWIAPARDESLVMHIRRGFPFQAPGILGATMGFLFPVILAGYLTATGVGFWAWSTVLSAPITAIVIVISGVTLPTLVRLRHTDPSAVPRATALMLRASMLVPATAAGLLLGFAPGLVNQVFGDRWNPAIGAVEMNLLGVLPATLSYFLAAVLESDQRAGARLWAGLVAAAVGIPLLFVLTSKLGVTGAAAVTAIIIPTLDVVVLYWFARVALVRAICGALVIFGASFLLARALDGIASSLTQLILFIALSIPVAVAAVWCTDRTAMRTVLRFGIPLPGRLRAWLKIPDVDRPTTTGVGEIG